MDVRTYLEQQQVHPQLIRAVEEFRNQYPVEEKVKYRVSDPMMPFYGTEILEMGIAALLQKENLLLSGSKATGKNVLAENLAWIFQRPTYNISFHVNTGSGDLIGTDTFEDNQVKLRKGSIYQCAEYGGFGILDEINMAKNDAVSVLHATLDYRRSIDVPGYDSGCNRLHLFDVDTIDESIVPENSINFNKKKVQKNLTLFLYPDDSDDAGRKLRIYQQYFMVSCGAELILKEMEDA